MTDFLARQVLPTVLNMSLTASVVIGCVLLARLLLRRAPKVFSYGLWAVVLFRLICPVSVTAHLSLLALLDAPVQEAAPYTSVVTYVPPESPIWPETPAAQTSPGPGNAGALSPSPGVSQAEEPRGGDPMVIVSLVWLAGVTGMAAYSLVSLVRLRRRLVGAVPLEGNVYLADHIDSPFVLGIFRPRIYLPSSLPERERGYILLHEEHHIRRLDHVVKLLSFLALCLHWFNPLVWLSFLLLGRDMEMSCDEAVMKKLGDGIRADYSSSLLSLATGRRLIAGAPLAFGEGDTRGRIRNVLSWKRPRVWMVVLAAVCCAVVVAACAFNPQGDGTDIQTPDSHGDPSPGLSPTPSHGTAALVPAKGTFGTAEDTAYYLELSAAGMEFTDMDAARRDAVLSEYGTLLEGYTFLARESTDGRTAYILGAYSGPPEENPLYLMYSVEVGDYNGGTVQVLYREEDSAAVEESLAEAAIPEVGTTIHDSTILYTADNYQSSNIVMIVPKDVSFTLSAAFNRYLYQTNGRAYIEDAAARGIAVNNPGAPCLYVYRVDETYGELAECIPLTQEQLETIQSEELTPLTPGFGFAATLHTSDDPTNFSDSTISYTEATGVPQTVLDLAREHCDYRFADPSYIRGPILGAVLEGSWLEEPRYADEADLARLEEILKNAQFSYVGSCGYGAKVTLTLTGGEQLTFFKGTDSCDTVLFGSWSGYSLGDRENTEFWEIFGLDPDTKAPLEG